MRKRRLAALVLLAACSTKSADTSSATVKESTYRQESLIVDEVSKLANVEGQAAPAGTALANRPTRGVIAGLGTTPVVDSRKIVRTGNLELVVKTYDDARDKIDAIVKEAGGFVDSTRVSRSEGQVSSAVIVVRVPAAGFGDLLPKLRALGDIQQESTDAADITAEYVDTSARLASAQALEKRLIELAGTRTGTVAEVLEVERELARVRGELEQLEGQMRLWNDQVSLSTLTISLSTQRPEIAAAAEPGFNRRVSAAWHASIDALGNAAQGLSIALIALLPWLPLLAPALYFGIRFLRRRVLLPRAVAYMPPAYPVAPPPPPAPGTYPSP
jgi:hypothetical protein